MKPNKSFKQFHGNLDALAASTAMQAARLNSLELLDTAEVLFELKRFAHSAAISILAIEESGKIPLLLAITLEQEKEISELWKSYRQHRAKTATLNYGIYGRIRVEFPNIPEDEARKIAANGPSPDDLESQKQRAIYSDCYLEDGKFVCHLPKNIDWRKTAWERLCEARSIVHAPRDKTPEEVDIWRKYAMQAKSEKRSLQEYFPQIHDELIKEGHIKEGWWDVILKEKKA